MAIKCCKDCVSPKRYPGCHSHCPEYIEEKAEYDRLKAAADLKRDTIQGIIRQRYDRVDRAYKRHGNYKTTIKRR